MNERTIHILQMEKHFLYLPFYYAVDKNFFGYLPDGINVTIGEPDSEHTDDAAYDQMMSESKDFRDFNMAITDPAQIVRTPLHSTRLPAVLATLVTNGAFWAVNHGRHKVNVLRDLGVFDRIIAFSKGTTSHNIAVRIAHESKKPTSLDDFIRVVAPGKELLLLSDVAGGANAVALSPDILQIEELVEGRREYSIELAIGDTEEYNNVIVTALVSNSDFVANNPEVVQAVVKGIQHALLLIHRCDPDVLRFARSYFRYANRAEGALNKAKNAGVIPKYVSIAKPHWMSAAKAHCEAGNRDATWTTAEEDMALKYYDICIQPYAKFAMEAERSDIAKLPPPPPPQAWTTLGQLVITFVVGVVITALWGWIPALATAIGMIVVWGFLRLFRYKHIRKTLRIGFLGALCALGIGAGILPFIESAGFAADRIALISLAVTCLVPAIWEAMNYADRSAK
jgi:hypothetical protein